MNYRRSSDSCTTGKCLILDAPLVSSHKNFIIGQGLDKVDISASGCIASVIADGSSLFENRISICLFDKSNVMRRAGIDKEISGPLLDSLDIPHQKLHLAARKNSVVWSINCQKVCFPLGYP